MPRRTVVLLGLSVAAAGVAMAPAASSAESAMGWSWSERLPSSSPSGGGDAELFSDNRLDRVFAVDSAEDSSGPASTWSWDGEGWTEVATALAPGGRAGTAIAYDRKRGYAVLFGGNDSAPGELGDTWTFDGERWTQLQPRRSPQPRTYHAMAYDPHLRQVVLYGGWNLEGYDRGDMWTWTGRTWKRLRPADTPGNRSDAGLALDRSRGSLVLFGGSGDRDDTWAWDGTTWVEVATQRAPIGRRGPVMTSLGKHVVLFGGMCCVGELLDDTWVLRDGGWDRLGRAAQPQERLSGAAAYDEARGEAVLFGGYWYEYGLLDDTWVLARGGTA